MLLSYCSYSQIKKVDPFCFSITIPVTARISSWYLSLEAAEVQRGMPTVLAPSSTTVILPSWMFSLAKLSGFRKPLQFKCSTPAVRLAFSSYFLSPFPLALCSFLFTVLFEMGVSALTVDSGFLRVFFVWFWFCSFFQFFCSMILGLYTSFMEMLFLLDWFERLAGNSSVEIEREKKDTRM